MYKESFELRHLRYFVAVAEELHFSRAAERLHIAQPPLSQQIRQLERILGVRLFERNRHAVALTSAGQLFLADARRILQQAEDAFFRMKYAQDGQIGRLAIGFVNTSVATDNLIPNVLALYRKRFPGVEVHLTEMEPHEQLRALEQREIQVGFTAIFQDLSTEFDSEFIQRIPFIAVCAPQHRFASQTSVALRDLVNEPFIFCQRHPIDPLYDRLIQLFGFSPSVTQEISNINILLGLVAANFGVSLVPASAMTLNTHTVVYRPLSDSDGQLAFETVFVWCRNDCSPILQEFLAVAREVNEQRKKMTDMEEWKDSRKSSEG